MTSVLFERLEAKRAALAALTDPELVQLVLQLTGEEWSNFQDEVFTHAAPRLAALVQAHEGREWERRQDALESSERDG